MCSYKFDNDKSKFCEWGKFFSQMRLEKTGILDNRLDLPHDSIGECIFHSRDLEWKRENNFSYWLNKLIFLLDNYDNENSEIELDEVIFVGNSFIEEQEVKYKMRAGSENELYCFVLEKIFCKKNICFNNSKFEDIIILERCCLKNDLILQNCHFSKGISIERFTVGGDLHIYNSCFQKRIVISNNNRANTIYGGLYIRASTFVGDSSFSELIITESCEIVNNEFKHIENEICFNCKFEAGLEFSNNSATSLAFCSCGFYYNTIFDNLKLLGKFSVLTPQIEGQLKFIGNKDDLLFNTKTTIEINLECFEENGMITFDYCNLLDLGDTFINNCRQLEEQKKIIIKPSCKVERLSVTFEFSNTELKKFLIQDFANIVCRFFYHWHRINLFVSITTDTERQLVFVIFKTTDDITPKRFNSLLKKLPKTICYTKDNKPEIKDIQLTLWNIIQRIFSNNALAESEKKAIITLNGNIFIMGDYIKQLGVLVKGKGNIVENPVIKQISESRVIDNSTVSVNNGSDGGKKKSLWKQITVGVIIAVIASTIWYFIQTLL